MNKNFNDWYREADPSFSEERLTKRWAGIEAFINKAEQIDALNAVKHFFGLATTKEFTDGFLDYFFQTDKTFSVNNSAHESRVLAGIAAFVYAEDNRDSSVYLALSSLHAESLGPSSPVPNLIRDSIQNLAQMSLELRQGKPEKPVIKPLKPASTALADEAKMTDHRQVAVQASSALNLINQAQTDILGYASAIQEAYELQQEELNILWWLYGEYSNTSRKFFTDLSIYEACLALPLDMNDFVHYLPGPIAAEAFLKKGLKSTKGNEEKNITLKKLMEKLPDDSKVTISALTQKYSNETLKFAPVLCCIHKCLHNGITSEWNKIDANITISYDKDIPPLTLSYQIYKEAVLLSSLTQESEE